MIFKYYELRVYIEEDFETFYKMGFNDKQLFPAILNEYEHGEGFSQVENVCIHLFIALNYKKHGLNYTDIINKIKFLLNEQIENEIRNDLEDEYSQFLEDFNIIMKVDMVNYYELKYLITETFYQNILDEEYTIGQTAGRCFVEFTQELKNSDIEAIIVISTILSRVAWHEKETLHIFEKDIKKMNTLLSLVRKEDISSEIFTLVKEDVDYVNGRWKQVNNIG